MTNKCSTCNLCDDAEKCSCGCPLTSENICSSCSSQEVCKYCCGCEGKE